MLSQWIGDLKCMLREVAAFPHYWFPYTFLDGRAWPPRGVDIELTFRCNMRCQVCPQERYKQRQKATGGRPSINKAEIGAEEIDRLVNDLADLGVRVVTLTGGEPFLHQDLLRIVDSVKKRRLLCSILSNGLLVKEHIARELVQAKVDTITFSLDGPPEVHDRVRGVAGAYERLCRSIRLIQEEKRRQGAKRPSIGLNCTISALNQENFSQLVDTACAYQLGSINFGYLFFTDQQAVEKTSRMVDIQQAKEEDQVLPPSLRQVDVARLQAELATAYQKAAQNGIYISFTPPLRGKELEYYFYNTRYAYCKRCFYPWFSSRINPYGDVYPCSMDLRMGNIRENPFRELWNNEKYTHFRRTLRLHKLFPKCCKCCNLSNKLWNYLH